MGKSDGASIPSAMEEAEAQIALERERAKLEQDRRNADKAAADADYAAKVAKAGPKQQQEFDRALGFGNTQVGARGLDEGLVDQYGVLDLFRSTLEGNRSRLAEDDATPVLGENTAFLDALGIGQNRYRNDLRRDYDTAAGDSNLHFADTMDDSILASILGEQEGNVMAQINAARDRGTLNEAGYGKALERFNSQKRSGNAQLQDLGRGVLSGYRSQYDTAVGTGRNKIGSAGFDNPFDTSSAVGALGSLRSSLSGRLGDDLYRATDGQSFFDPNAIIGHGASMQGFFNPSKKTGIGGDNELLASFIDPKKTGSTLTSAGSNGVF